MSSLGDGMLAFLSRLFHEPKVAFVSILGVDLPPQIRGREADVEEVAPYVAL